MTLLSGTLPDQAALDGAVAQIEVRETIPVDEGGDVPPIGDPWREQLYWGD